MFFFKKALLDEEFFATPPNCEPLFYAGKIAVQHQGGTYAIESIRTLPKLLMELKHFRHKPILRFIVDKNGIAWFAKESAPGIDAPKHFQMTGQPLHEACCLTAGNIKFNNSSCTVLKSINHKSGDFQPTFDSLRVFIALLILNEPLLPFKLPKNLQVKRIGHDGSTVKKYKWPLTQIREWVQNCTEKLLLKQLNNQCAQTKIVSYEAIETSVITS